MTSAERWFAVRRLAEIPMLSARGYLSRAESASVSIADSGNLNGLAIIGSDDDPCPDSRLIPWSLAARVAVHSDSARRELLARRYDNFDPAELDVVVREELFEVPVGPESEPPAAAEPPVAPDSDRGQITVLDRRVGAACGLLAVPVPAAEAELRDAVAAKLLASGEPAVDEVLAALGVDQHDVGLLAAMVSLLEEVDPSEAFGARAAVDRLLADIPLESSSSRDLHLISAVIRGERDLPRFQTGSGRLLPKAILMMVTRPDPHDAMSWLAGAPEDPMAVALCCAFAGLRSGWARLPSGWKVDRPWRFPCEAAICDGLEGGSSCWTAISGSPAGAVAPAKRRRSDLERGSDRGAVPAGIGSRARLALLSDADVAAACARICEARGWVDLVTSTLELRNGSFSYNDGRIVVDGPVKVGYVIDGAFLDRWAPEDGDLESRALSEMLERLTSEARPQDPDGEDQRSVEAVERRARRTQRSSGRRQTTASAELNEGTLFDQP